jgi:organic hydroperoxide reductase OsmC/OhrA
MNPHHYSLIVNWTGNRGKGTSGYRSYERSHEIVVEGKKNIKGSSDPSFLGDRTKFNPEELLLASISSCHMLWYLHLCSDEGVIVTNYLDDAKGTMIETENGGGKFESVSLHPTVTVKDISMVDKAMLLHTKANELCFIANSVNFKIQHVPIVIVE